MLHSYSVAYSEDWADISLAVKQNAGWKCEICGTPNNFETGHILTVHHLDGREFNNDPENLIAACQRCHLKLQGRLLRGSHGLTRAKILLDVEAWRRQQTLF